MAWHHECSKPSPEAMMTKFYNGIWHHHATMSQQAGNKISPEIFQAEDIESLVKLHMKIWAFWYSP